MPTSRLFLALWPPAAAVQSLAAWADGWQWPPGAKVEPPARWHLTLHFIGALPSAQVPALAAALGADDLGRVNADTTATPVACTGLGVPACEATFGTPARWPGGLVVLCPSIWPPELTALHGRLGSRLQAAGVAVETRPFRPHLTLARRAAGAVAPTALPAVRWPVDQVALVESRGGYRTIAVFR